MITRTTGLQGLLCSGAVGNPLTFSWDAAADEYDGATGLTLSPGQSYLGAVSISATNAVMTLGQPAAYPTTTFTNANTNASMSLNGTWYVGQDPIGGGGAREWDGRIKWLALWYRTLPINALNNVHAEPYAFLRPIIRRRYFIFTPAAQAAQNIFIQEHIGRGIGRGVFVGR